MRHPLTEALTDAGIDEKEAAIWTLALRDADTEALVRITRALTVMLAYLQRNKDAE